jgi:hypothetical protein
VYGLAGVAHPAFVLVLKGLHARVWFASNFQWEEPSRVTRRDPRLSSGPGWKHAPSRGYGPQRWYRASRRGTLLRLAIPAVLGITIAGFAVGVAIAYLADGGGGAQSPVRMRPPSHAVSPTTQHAGTSRSRPQAGSGAPSQTTQSPPTSAAPASGHRLNDEGYALIRRGAYAAAIPPLRKAAADLAGAGPTDPYEAYANYNLGYALMMSDRCTEALAPLEAANRLETSPAVDRALREAHRCAPAGS